MMQLFEQPPEKPPRTDGHRRVAMVVEDDRFFADVLVEMLTDIGFDEVWQAVTEGEALALLERNAPDVAIVDTNLFGIPAHRVAERLRSRHVPFIVVTGFDPSRLPTSLTASPTLRKPIRQADLAAALIGVTSH